MGRDTHGRFRFFNEHWKAFKTIEGFAEVAERLPLCLIA